MSPSSVGTNTESERKRKREGMAKARSTPQGRARQSWVAMRGRCLDEKNPSFPRYGGRGIAICDRWIDSFETFLADMGGRPPGTSLDRINNDGHYEPRNCRWATQKEQSRNTSVNHLVTWRGETKCLQDWADATGIGVDAIFHRLKVGWSVDAALTTPPSRDLLTFDGRSESINEWARITGIKADTIGDRLKRGWSVERALTTPGRSYKRKT